MLSPNHKSTDAIVLSPLDKNPATRPLRRGDLVRLSEIALTKGKRFKDREGALGRINKLHNETDHDHDSPIVTYDVEWILGGRILTHCQREDLTYTTAAQEGMTQEMPHRQRSKRKPLDFMQEVEIMEQNKRQQKQKQQQHKIKKSQSGTSKSALRKDGQPKLKPGRKPKHLPATDSNGTVPHSTAAATSSKKAIASSSVSSNNNNNNNNKQQHRETGTGKAKKRRKVGTGSAVPAEQAATTDVTTNAQSSSTIQPQQQSSSSVENTTASSLAIPMYERHRREFERALTRLEEKIDIFRHFGYNDDTNEAKTIPPEYVETYDDNSSSESSSKPSVDFPAHAPYNWLMIRRRMEHGRYILDRRKREEDQRWALFAEYYFECGRQRSMESPSTICKDKNVVDPRVLHPYGVHWELFRDDVLAMCQAALARRTPEEIDEDMGQKGSLSYTVKKITEAVLQYVERCGTRHAQEMDMADDRHKFALAVTQKTNTEAAMQSWRCEPYPERKYERLSSDVVCAGLSEIDERIARHELRTNLHDSFLGISYRYDDTGQSEAWMKSVVDETGSNGKHHKSRTTQSKKANNDERDALLAMAADEGVRRAQVNATMQSLLIAVQDRVMTEANVLRQPELRSANWIAENDTATKSYPDLRPNSEELPPEIIEHPVWGIDCYTRRNIQNCLEIEFKPEIALIFIEKWLLPAINACPVDLGHNISNAARILEGLPFEGLVEIDDSPEQRSSGENVEQSNEAWSQSLLGRSLLNKIHTAGPSWLRPAANQLRRAHRALGPNFFRVHPKGHGSLVLSSKLKPNTLVTFYRGELYPSWRWGEKMDAIEITQRRKHLKPALPDFYNMALERPQIDPRGYGLLFVDASRKAGHGSSLSHSCAPTCEVRVAAVGGELCLAMTTLRELELGEELTFDYNAVTESLNEYRSAVCLCGHGKCRGSFLHFATADCYQQVMNRNCPIASRFASLVKGSMKRVMSPDDEELLKNHGFQTAAFGAISVNRRELAKDNASCSQLVDSLDNVPVWLRTYVADALRYIEYERRALPISLICDHLHAANNEQESEEELQVEPTKEPKFEGAFFYFSRTESKFLLDLLKREGMADSVTGIRRKHMMLKVGSSYWNALTDEKKQYWKDKAQEDYKRRLRAWQAAKKNALKQSSSMKKTKPKKKPGISDILHASNISFQDADAEGILAMEQRIQQLTQSLSRIGRVLDRHREECIDSNAKIVTFEAMRELVHSPLLILSDSEVVSWMWNNPDGVVQSLLREVKLSRCVRPVLLEKLQEIRDKYSDLSSFGDDGAGQSSTDSIYGRSRLRDALLEIRYTILAELSEMSREYREFRNDLNPATEDNCSRASSEENVMKESMDAPATLCDSSMVVMSGDSCDNDDYDDTKADINPQQVEEIVSESLQETKSNPDVDLDIPSGTAQWKEFYSERSALEAAADLLLLYARTSNFFVLKPYHTLDSTPVEVYARELGNTVPKSIIDDGIDDDSHIPTTVAVGVTPLPEDTEVLIDTSERDNEAQRADAKKGQYAICAPDDIVARVTVKYKGDYVLSQLLQWYNGGIGQKPGLPDLLGCTVLPTMKDCWSSELLETNRKQANKKTTYELKVRPRLVEWMQDIYQRGSPWPPEIRKAFSRKDLHCHQEEYCSSFHPFGTPIIDFLVTGDESNITSILSELDADDKICAKKSTDGLLSSLDKGRPAQAVSTWVQCENPTCNKWRKIPWYVDADLLPEKFFCKDNKWNPAAQTCDAPEDDWDDADAIVGPDGKIEGSPVKKVDEERLSVLEESSFRIGNRFDVMRSDRNQYCIATVTKVDFSGLTKRIMFHFRKTSSDRDEWIEFGSPRIAPLHSKVPKKKAKLPPIDVHVGKMLPVQGTLKCNKQSKLEYKSDRLTKPMDREGLHKDSVEPKVKKSNINKRKLEESMAPSKGYNVDAEGVKGLLDRTADLSKPPKRKYTKSSEKAKMKISSDPSREDSYFVGARFDVKRKSKDRFFHATVKEVDFTGPVKRILFHFSKTHEKFDEWIDFGSPSICPFDSKVSILRQEKAETKKRKEEGEKEKVLVSQTRSDQPKFEEDVLSARQISVASDELPSNNSAEGYVVSSEKSLPNQNKASFMDKNAPVQPFSDSRLQFSSHIRQPDFISTGSGFASFSAPADMSRHLAKCTDANVSCSNLPKQSSSHGFSSNGQIVSGLSGLDILAAISAQNSLNEQAAARGSNVYETPSATSVARFNSNLPPSHLLQQQFHHQQNIQHSNVSSFQDSHQFMDYVQGQQMMRQQQHQQRGHSIHPTFFLPHHDGQKPSQSYP